MKAVASVAIDGTDSWGGYRLTLLISVSSIQPLAVMQAPVFIPKLCKCAKGSELEQHSDSMGLGSLNTLTSYNSGTKVVIINNNTQ
jgi:hypothetical protein